MNCLFYKETRQVYLANLRVQALNTVWLLYVVHCNVVSPTCLDILPARSLFLSSDVPLNLLGCA